MLRSVSYVSFTRFEFVAADRYEEDQPAPKRRLSSTVVKMEKGEILEDDADAWKVSDAVKDSSAVVTRLAGNSENQNDWKVSNWARRDGVHRVSKMDSEVLHRKMFLEYCQKTKIPSWLIGIKEC